MSGFCVGIHRTGVRVFIDLFSVWWYDGGGEGKGELWSKLQMPL